MVISPTTRWLLRPVIGTAPEWLKAKRPAHYTERATCGDGLKPEGMHWRIFERLTAEHDDLRGGVTGEMARRFGIKL